jgi:hypothetical protein
MKRLNLSPRSIAPFLAAIAGTIGASYGLDYLLHRPLDPAEVAREIDEGLARYPLIEVAKESDPELFKKSRDELIALTIQSGGKRDAATEARAQEIGRRLTADIIVTSAHADDERVLDWLRREVALLTGLAAENKEQCAKRSLGVPFNAVDMTAHSQEANIAVMQAIASAYREGKVHPAPIPPENEARRLILSATKGPQTAFSEDEFTQFGKLASQPPNIVCALTLKLYMNVLYMPHPEAAKIARFIHAAPHNQGTGS